MEDIFYSNSKKGTGRTQKENAGIDTTSYSDKFEKAIEPKVPIQKDGKQLKRAIVTIGSEAVLQGRQFRITRKYDMKRWAWTGATAVPHGEMTSRPGEEGPKIQIGKFMAIKAPGSKYAGYQGRTKNVLWWELFEYGVQAHYIYSGKVFGETNAPLILGRFLRMEHGGIGAYHFFREVATRARRGHYKFTYDVGRWTKAIIKKAVQKSIPAARKRK